MTGRAGLLFTGFGPFPGMPSNPSAALARRLAGSPRLRPGLRVLVLDTTYAALRSGLAPALAERPAAVLMIGVASRALRIRVEAQALNRTSRLHPDASGRASRSLAIDPGGPTARRSAVTAQALAVLRRHGIAAGPSRDAGRYLCNAAYYRALAEPCPVLFVHIPPVPRTRRPRSANGRRRDTGAAQARALAEVALLLAARARRQD